MGHSCILMELTVSWGRQHIIQYRCVVELQPWDSGNRESGQLALFQGSEKLLVRAEA